MVNLHDAKQHGGTYAQVQTAQGFFYLNKPYADLAKLIGKQKVIHRVFPEGEPAFLIFDIECYDPNLVNINLEIFGLNKIEIEGSVNIKTFMDSVDLLMNHFVQFCTQQLDTKFLTISIGDLAIEEACDEVGGKYSAHIHCAKLSFLGMDHMKDFVFCFLGMFQKPDLILFLRRY
jgi:hypothetical protein